MTKPGILIAAVIVTLCSLCGSAYSSPGRAGWTRTDIQAVTQPVLVDGVVVVYAAAGGSLRVVGLDPASGTTLWSRAASPSRNAPGQQPELAVTGGKVIYLRAAAGVNAEVAVLDPRNGSLLWNSVPAAFRSWPDFCPDQPALVCAAGSPAANPWVGAQLRFDVRPGTALDPLVYSSNNNARSVGDGLFDLGSRSPEKLDAIKGSTGGWVKPLAAIYTLPGASTDFGWSFDRFASRGLFVGSPGWEPSEITQLSDRYDLSRAMTAGFRISDGAVAWRDQGSTYACDVLPCQGNPLGGAFTPGPDEGPSVGLRLRDRGTINEYDSVTTLSGDADVSIEGFDPATGRTLWRFDAGRDLGLIFQDEMPPMTGPHTIVLRNRAGRLERLDLATGVHEPVSAGDSAWCRTALAYQMASGYHGKRGGPPVHTYTGQPTLFPCNSRMQAIPIPDHAPSLVASIGARWHDLVIWNDGPGLVARPPQS
jgi:hypothetical protein